MSGRILIIGACGQIGTELTLKLREIYGEDKVIASDIREGAEELMQSGTFIKADAKNKEQLENIIRENQIKDVYLMAAMLSATAEKAPMQAWDLNMNSLFHVLNFAKEGLINKIFWPSSIAVFGPSTPKDATPQTTVMEPTTVYGISKLTGERWCEYYYNKFGVDVRSIRYPGIISYKTLPGGGTTDYAIDIFHEAVKTRKYTSFLAKDAALPMMFMDDAIKATIEIMQAPEENIHIRSSYNLAAISFTPEILAGEIKKHFSDFEINYDPDFRQKIAESWPSSIDDSAARKDWGWQHDYDLEKMTDIMIEGVEHRLQEKA
ncbi:NAD-dependent epimerase [Christiangramia fulva]|uniref:NAD-dependent epimerase n=1 Tax=Christiangramia fulva TaxID=2126553 RepID=A0A2R3Z434_9FLAO|nr:NAD-dependent epimerase/dehydratase family protein [Christiangramia fulva]AVR45019.1 NAD-dependent epimerase [Christiangramia fulva]